MNRFSQWFALFLLIVGMAGCGPKIKEGMSKETGYVPPPPDGAAAEPAKTKQR